MRWFKLLSSLSFIGFSFGVFGARATGRLFPVFPAAVLAVFILLPPLIFSINRRSKQRFYLTLSILVFFAISIRLFIFMFPESMIAFDPDTFAISIQTIVVRGDTAEILSTFYRNIPLFHIFTAMFSQIAMVTPAQAMGIWPIIVGVLFPLSAVIFSLYLNHDFKSALAAGALMAVLSNSVAFSYTPIPNLLAAALFLPFMICFIRSFYSGYIYLIPVNALFLALIFTHKLHPVIIVSTISIIFILLNVQRLVDNQLNASYFSTTTGVLVLFFVIAGAWAFVVQASVPELLLLGAFVFGGSVYRITKFNDGLSGNDYTSILNATLTRRHVIRNILLLFGVLLLLQWLFMTNLISAIFRYWIYPLVSQPELVTSTQPEPVFAKTVDPGLLNIFYHRSDILLLLLPMSFGWVYFFYSRSDVSSLVLLIVTGVPLALMPSALFAGVSGGLGAQRVMLLFSSLGVALITAFLFDNSNKLIKFTFVVLIVVQVFSVGFVPDYPHHYRKYLTDEEISGKEFGLDVVPDLVYTDFFYSTESVLPVTQRGQTGDKALEPNTKFKSFGKDLLHKDIVGGKYQYVSLRREVTVYRMGSHPTQVTLTWNPEQTFNTNINYKRFYDNGGVLYYSQ